MDFLNVITLCSIDRKNMDCGIIAVNHMVRMDRPDHSWSSSFCKFNFKTHFHLLTRLERETHYCPPWKVKTHYFPLVSPIRVHGRGVPCTHSMNPINTKICFRFHVDQRSPHPSAITGCGEKKEILLPTPDDPDDGFFNCKSLFS